MTPLPFTWDGESLKPAPGFAKRADAQFVIGQRYMMEPIEERSAISHRHFFACVNDVFANLPDHLAERFASPESLRKFALIKAGYADSRQIVCASKAEAQRVAAFIRPMDVYAIVEVREAVVTVWTAQSQSVKAMGKAAFQESKDRVLDVLAAMIDATPKQLGRAA